MLSTTRLEILRGEHGFGAAMCKMHTEHVYVSCHVSTVKVCLQALRCLLLLRNGSPATQVHLRMSLFESVQINIFLVRCLFMLLFQNVFYVFYCNFAIQRSGRLQVFIREGFYCFLLRLLWFYHFPM